MGLIQDLRRAGPPRELAAVLPALLEGDLPPGATCLRKGFVFRVDDLVIKFYSRSPRRLGRLRQARALRAIKNFQRLGHVYSPKPLHWERLEHERFGSLLVYEFVPGKTLRELWKQRDPEPLGAPLGALPQLFADLHAVGVLHADLHAQNLIWSKKGWCVLDLDGVRHGLHALRRRSITERIWARLLFDLEGDPVGQDLYLEFLRLAGQPWSPEASWARILKRYGQVLKQRS